MKPSLLKAVLLFWIFAPLSLNAVEKGNLSSFETGSSSLTEVGEPPEVARVRVPLRLTFFEQVVVKGEDGIRRMEYKPLTPKRYTFKATINRANHFYVSDWHVESVPTRWDRDSKSWEVDVKFYKRYGEEQELEEYVGTMSIKGVLQGKDMLYTLEAKGQQKFRNKGGNPLLLVETSAPGYEEKGNVARGGRNKTEYRQ